MDFCVEIIIHYIKYTLPSTIKRECTQNDRKVISRVMVYYSSKTGKKYLLFPVRDDICTTNLTDLILSQYISTNIVFSESTQIYNKYDLH